MAKTFEFDDFGIAKIFSSYTLSIPPHQRDYAWTDEEVSQLFEDLENAYRTNSEYFLGTIVAIERENSGSLSVVDGQQRLTTTYLLLTAIRNYLLEVGEGKDISDSLEEQYLCKTDRKEGSLQRLVLNTDDREFFRKLTAKEKGDEWPPKESRISHGLLKSAYFKALDRVRLLVKSVSAVDATETLNAWLDYLEQSAQVILLRAHDESRAFKMFETLNDRGLKTSQADLVKSYLFGLASGDIEAAQTRWSNMLENLQELSGEDQQLSFLRHYIIANVDFSRADDVYDVVRRRTKNSSSASTMLSALAAGSKRYVATFNHDHEHWNSHSELTRRQIAEFNFFDLKPMRPLLFALAVKFQPKQFEKTISLLVSLSVRLVLSARTRSGVNEQTFAETALAVSQGRIANHNEIVSSLQKVFVSDKDFKQLFAVANVSKTKLARYYLRTIEEANSKKREKEWVNWDPNVLTLEHILPKTLPEKGWGQYDTELHKEYRNRIGNFCLLVKTKNNSMPTQDFSVKKDAYKESDLELTQSVSNNASWNPSDIEKRQETLAELAVKTWPLI